MMRTAPYRAPRLELRPAFANRLSVRVWPRSVQPAHLRRAESADSRTPSRTDVVLEAWVPREYVL